MVLVFLKKNTSKHLLLIDVHKILKEHLIYILWKILYKNKCFLEMFENRFVYYF